MSRYRVTNLSFETPVGEQQKLESALKKVHGVRSVTISPMKREFSITFTGMEPNYNLLKDVCTGAGFTLARRAS
jgi:hypothetical protein